MESVTSSARNEVGDVDSGQHHALDGGSGPSPLASTQQDAQEGSSEVDVAKRVAQRVDRAVDVTQPVTCNTQRTETSEADVAQHLLRCNTASNL